MLLTTRQHLANNVAERFYNQYGPYFNSTSAFLGGFDSRAKYNELLDLGKTPSIEAVERSMKGWTLLQCDECKKSVEAVVQVGQPPDYESSTASICIDCAKAALKMLEAS